MNKTLKILTLVAWEVEKTDSDDLSKHSANIFHKAGGYWFLKYWGRKQDYIEVKGISASRVLEFLEQRLLKVFVFHALWYVWQSRKYDLIICFHSMLGLPVAFFFRILGIKKPLVVLDVEGIGRKTHPLARRVINFALPPITLLFYFASAQPEDYARYYPQIIPRAHFLPLGIDPPRFPLNLEPQGDYIAAVGHHFRDWETLVKAYELCHTDTPLLIVGKNGFTSEDLRNPASLPKGIRFAGKVGLPEFNQLVGNSLFVILPLIERHQSNGAMTTLTCMAMGKAIIAPDVSGIRDFVSDGETVLLYKPYDPFSLAARMSHLLNAPESGEIISLKAHAHVTDKFSERVMGKKFSEIVNQFILTDNSKVTGADN